MGDAGSDGGDAGRFTVLVAIAANIGIMLAKGAAWLFTGSVSMMAETMHSVADTANQGLLLYGHRRSRKDPDPAHPFGYGRERYFWPFVYSILIFGLGALVSLWQGVTDLLDPEPISNPFWAFVVLGASAVMDGTSLWNARRQADKSRRGVSYWRFVQRSRDPEIPVVLLEDSAGVSGVLVAMIAVAISVTTGLHVFDAIGSLVIGLLLAGVAGVLAREMKSLLIGEPATPEDEQLIRQVVREYDEVDELVLLRTLHLGPQELLVDMKLRLTSSLDADAVARLIDDMEQEIRDRVDDARIIAVEPDIPQPDDPDVPDYARDP
ncbi:MAG: cation diffusion facilitator family transporter [Nitriliruptorales bacterium]|nr:cation diffusion facilitator family transporter [Nitriliruptorales bacterium]